MQPQSNTKYIFIILVLLVLLIVFVSWSLYLWKTTMPKSTVAVPGNISSELLDSQTASFNGEILSINDRAMTVKNKRGITGTIVAGPTMFISDMTKPGIAVPSTDLKSVMLNKEVSIQIQVINGEYQAMSMTYFSTAPNPVQATGAAPPPNATSSAVVVTKTPAPAQTSAPVSETNKEKSE